MVCFSEVVLCYSPWCLKCRRNLNSHSNGENIIWGGELFLSPQMNVLFPSNSQQFLLGIDRLLFGCWERWGYKTGTVPQKAKILFHNFRSWAHLLKCTGQRLFPSFLGGMSHKRAPVERTVRTHASLAIVLEMSQCLCRQCSGDRHAMPFSDRKREVELQIPKTSAMKTAALCLSYWVHRIVCFLVFFYVPSSSSYL